MALIAVAVLAVFGQTFNDEYIAFDDRDYLSGNRIISQGLTAEGLRFAFTGTVVSHWNPVTVLSHMVMVEAFGLEPGPHHATNVAIHLASALLVYGILFRMTGAAWPALFAALLFAVHPLRAESVAWIAERKGLLCGFFGLLMVWAYAEYARKPALWRYLVVAAAFALSLMSKAALMSLPVALLLLDYWPLSRWPGEIPNRWRTIARLAAEKLPLLVLAVVAAVIAYTITARNNVMRTGDEFSLMVRAANAVRSYFLYLSNSLVPFHLAPQYPHLGRTVFGPVLYAGIIALATISLAAIYHRKRAPWFFMGWFWFIITLAPLSGVIQVANQGRADRYTYLPQIGLCVVVAWGIATLVRRFPRASKSTTAVAVVAILVLTIAGFVQTRLWRDDFALFSYAVTVNPQSAMVHYGLGVAHLKRDEIDLAEQCFLRAIDREPPIPEAYSNLGAIELRRENFTKSTEYFAQALELDGSDPDLLVNYAVALSTQGRKDEAFSLLAEALRLAPDHERALLVRDQLSRIQH